MAFTCTAMSVVMMLLTIQLLQPFRSRALQLSVWNMYQNGSRLLPKHCDQACASQLRTERLFAGAGRRNETMSHGHDERDSTTPWARVEFNGKYTENFVTVIVGGGDDQKLLLDTGSYFTWIKRRRDGPGYGGQAARMYDPDQSKRVLSNDPFCQSLLQTPQGSPETSTCCSYTVSYDDNGVTKGCVVKDAITFWYLGGKNHWLPNIKFGCSDYINFHIPTGTSGLLGLANSHRGLSLPEQLTGVGYESDLSYCLPPIDTRTNGFLYFGADAIPSSEAFPTTAFVRGPVPELQYIHVIGILIDNTVVGIPTDVLAWDPNTGRGATLIDTGSPLTQVTPRAYKPLRQARRDALSRRGLRWPKSDLKGLDTCYDYSQQQAMPTLEYVMRGGKRFVPRPIGNKFVYRTKKGQLRMCWPFKVTKFRDGRALQIGGIALQSIRIIHDAKRDMLGWMDGKC